MKFIEKMLNNFGYQKQIPATPLSLTILETVQEQYSGRNFRLVQIEKMQEDTLNEIKEIKKIMKANVFQNKFDFTKKERGWCAEWKLTTKQREEIAIADGTHNEIAKKYGVSRSYVGQIKQNYKK